MNKQRKFGRHTIVLLLAPAIALGGLGAWFSSRGPSKPFKLAINEIKVTPLTKSSLMRTPPTPNARPIQVAVFIGHEGPAPDWWGVDVNSPDSRVHFTTDGEKDDHYTNVGGYTGVSFDKQSRLYTFTYTGEVPKDPEFMKRATSHVSADLETATVPHRKLARAKASIAAHAFE